MQRVRMSLPYFAKFGWDAEVVCVDAEYSEIVKDDLLVQSVPGNIPIHTVKALSKRYTARFGLGSLALRSLWFYRKTVNKLLSTKKFDLVYFSTTQFPLCILGAYWKKRFGIPYIIDMQDPWHSEYYRDKPKAQQPAKYWFSYRLNKYLEPVAMRGVGGLISVSENYITILKERYSTIKNIPQATITFGAYLPDLKTAEDNKARFAPLLDPAFKNIVYVGRGGADMHKAVNLLFKAYCQSVAATPALSNIKFYFIGTSYAPNGQGVQTILPLAKQYKIENNVIEVTDRISYYHTLLTLQQADALFIPGSDDPNYTASKIYPYILAEKPLLAVFNGDSPALKVLNEYKACYAYSYDMAGIHKHIGDFLIEVSTETIDSPVYADDAVVKYSAENMTRKQCLLFDEVPALS
jgi:hypothetical protein